MGAGDACYIALDLEGGNSSSTLPTFDVDSNLGTAAANAVDLTADNSVVVTDLQFSPTTSTVGQLVRTTATITVPTEYNLSGSFSFSVTLPDGLQVASIPNSEASCSEANAQLDFSSIDFSPGAIEITWSQNIILLSFLPLSGDTTCTLAFDAQVTGLGDLQAGSSGLTGVASFNPSSASSVSNIASFGTARIATTNSDLYLSHSFSPALVSTGSAVTADYVITNTTRDTATSIQFSHDLGAIDCVDTNGACPSNAPGWVPTNLPLSDVCGVGSSLSEENPGVITLSGASINSSESCSFSVTTQLPGTESEGVYTSTISDLSGSGLSGGESQAALRIQTGVEVSFEFDGSPSKIGAGTPNNLIVTLSNASAALSATEVSGTINLPAGFPSGSVVAPASGSCGPGSSFGTTADFSGNVVALRFTDATLNANDSCSLTYAVEFVEGYDGAAVFLADDVVFTANSQVFESPQFNYSIEVTAPPKITLVTSASSVSKGDSFDLMLGFEDEDRDRENIGLTLDVEAVLPGQTPGDNMVLASNSCVGGSFALVDGVLTVSGLEEQDCEASVTVTAASTAALGSKTFSATAISATDGGIFGEGSDLSATVQIGALIAAVSVSPSIALPTDDL